MGSDTTQLGSDLKEMCAQLNDVLSNVYHIRCALKDYEPNPFINGLEKFHKDLTKIFNDANDIIKEFNKEYMLNDN